MAEYECLEDFVPVIRMEVSDIDDRTILMMLSMAQQKFCRDTRVLQQVTTTIIDITEDTYPCIPQWEGFNQSVDVIQTGKVGATLRPLRFNDQWTISADRNSIILDESYRKNSVEGFQMDIVSTVIPFHSTTQIDENVYELYSEPIIALTKHLIYNQKLKPWSDKLDAKELLFEYNELLNTVNFDTIQGGNTTGDQSINLNF